MGSVESKVNVEAIKSEVSLLSIDKRRVGFYYILICDQCRINRRPDGFFRKDRVSIPAFYPHDSRNSQPQKATCEPSYQSLSCEEENEWVAGIAPLLNVSAFPLVLQCCSFEPLSLSSNRGIATVHPGQIVVGGESFIYKIPHAQTLSSNPIPFVADNERILYPSSAVESKNDITGPFEDNMNLEEITSLSDTEVDSKILPSVLLQQNQKSLQKVRSINVRDYRNNQCIIYLIRTTTSTILNLEKVLCKHIPPLQSMLFHHRFNLFLSPFGSIECLCKKLTFKDHVLKNTSINCSNILIMRKIQIIVNGIYASCHSIIKNHSLQNSFFTVCD
uniref:Uncharacterized protein n=1 Tax=Heterorhabditis bacteriophora TaxID=37862 RepID=A0A1I7X6F5_HETBA